MTLTTFFAEKYRPHNPNLKPRSIALYNVTFKKFRLYLGREPTLEDLNDDAIGGYMVALTSDHLAAGTVNKERANLLSLWRHAHALGIKRTGPLVKRLTEPGRIPTALSVEQVQRLFTAFLTLQGKSGGLHNADFIKAVASIQFTTGCRVGEVLQLRWDDIDGNVLTFRAETRKGGRSWIVKQVPPWVLKTLDVIREPERERVFPVDPDCGKIQLLYARAFKRAGVPRPKWKSSHLLRATHATMVHSAGGNATASLGHSSSAVTKECYLDPRYSPDDNWKKLPDLDQKIASGILIRLFNGDESEGGDQ